MSFDHLHHRSHPHHHQAPAPLHDQLRRQQQQQQYTGAAFGYNGMQLHGAGSGGGDMFASAEDRLLLQSMQAAQMPPASVANNSSLGFFA
ncbi:hypothetical protein EJB05_41874, partial [Eragrostis curvula]